MELKLKEKKHKCVLCGQEATLQLSENSWICETCAQIQGELAER